MKTVGFIGAYDKTDLILYVARILTEAGKSVLMIDATKLQKAKYIVPTILPDEAYVTNFEGIDVAIGFSDYNEIKLSLGMPVHAAFEYDYILIDVDQPEKMKSFNIQTANINYFVTGFDNYSLKRGLEILECLEEPIPLKKVLFSKDISKEEDNYLNHLSLGTKAIWNEEKIYFPFESGDQTIIIQNQMVSKIRLKKLSEFYKSSLEYIASEIIEDEKINLRKAIKQLEKKI